MLVRLRNICLIVSVSLFVLACATGEKKSIDGGPKPDKTEVLDGPRLEGVAPPDTTLDGPRPDTTVDGPRPDGPRPDTTVDGTRPPDSTHDQFVPPRDSTVDQTVDQFVPPRDSTVDQFVPPLNIGATCARDEDCVSPGRCVLSIGGLGICTIADCTVDDLFTAQNEDSCPDLSANICGVVNISTGTRNYCLKRCQPRSSGNDCPSGLACAPASGSITQLHDVAVCTDIACQSGSDCPVFTGGTCNTSTLQGCNAGELCKVYGTSGYCTLSGNCNTVSGMCEGHGRGQSGVAIGAPCASDVDCGNNMICLEQSGSGSSINWRQGYCTIASCVFGSSVSAFACPTGSACNRAYLSVGGFCQKTCDPSQADACRGQTGDVYGDYECYAWNRVFDQSSTPFAAMPVCDTPVPCDFLSLGCPGLGSAGNPTNMVCRNLQGSVLASGLDPSGFCLDTTTSGAIQ